MKHRKSLHAFALYLFIIALPLLLVNMGYTATPNQLPLGVRPLGMGEAFVAVADDVNAIAWNPAGLAQLCSNLDVNMVYTDLYGTGLKHSYLSGATRLTEYIAIGVDWAHIGFDDGELDIGDDRFSLSCGVRLPRPRQLSFGASARHVRIHNSLDGISLGKASGFGIDTALRFESKLRLGKRNLGKVSFGFFGQDLTNTKVKLESGKNAEIAPHRFRLGAAYRLPKDDTDATDDMDNAVIALDWDICDRIHIGAESWFRDLLALRCGITKDIRSFHLPDSDSKFCEPMSFALGGSIKLPCFDHAQFDWVYMYKPPLGNTFDNLRFALTLALPDPAHVVHIESVQLADVLASYYRLYAERSPSVGKLLLRSSHTKKVRFKIFIFIPGYMDEPTEVANGDIPAAEPGKVSEQIVFLSLPLNPKKIRSLAEDVEAEALITVTYWHKWERQRKEPKKLTIRAMGKVAYRDRLDPMVAFIDPCDQVVRKSAKTAIKVPLEITEPVSVEIHRASENIFKAMQVFEALNEHGIRYAEDDLTPFQSVYSRNTFTSDPSRGDQTTPFRYIERKGPFKRTRYPRELLSVANSAGDCDDLSILYASLLEALEIQTQLIDVESRVFVMFDSGLSEDKIRELNLDDSLFVKTENSDIFWVPIETTMFGNPFIKAWEKGVDMYTKAKNQGILRCVDVHKQRETYPPIHPTKKAIAPKFDSPPMSEGIKQRVQSNLTGFDKLLKEGFSK